MAGSVGVRHSGDALRDIRLLQAAAARAGNIENLRQLYSEAGQWWEQTADAAFGDGKLDTFYWLQTQDPPCPWSFPAQEWALDLHIRGRFSYPRYRRGLPLPDRQKYNLRHRRMLLLEDTLKHAAACASQPARLFFDGLIVLIVMLQAMQRHGSDWLHLCWAVEQAAEGGLVETMKWLLKYTASDCEGNRIMVKLGWIFFAAAAEAGQLTISKLLKAHRSTSSGWDQECGIEACNNGHRHILEWLSAHEYPWTLEC